MDDQNLVKYLPYLDAKHIYDPLFPLNDFKMRIGLNCGDLIAGAIGEERPHHDIWGDTVNCASRMRRVGDFYEIGQKYSDRELKY